ncbi:YlqD family protein [Cytobacillus spongiae]|jgi:septin family protein|uniref:YlqD family protein n=1 Tax=Cytobacillus spongiae TaxID=2901381 RepID=UPI001F25765F|nr:YlqD family protein [Cytobacillus spongiae]UII57391.1 YlqD family protein [Cytobacillus spongiae]
MKILQTVVVKQVLTEKSKQKLLDEYHAKKLQIQKECDQLRFEMKKLEKANRFQSNSLKNHFEKEVDMRQEKLKLLEFQIEQLHILELGSELKEKEVQAIIDVNEGDRWDELLNHKTIVIKDGIVDEIR